LSGRDAGTNYRSRPRGRGGHAAPIVSATRRSRATQWLPWAATTLRAGDMSSPQLADLAPEVRLRPAATVIATVAPFRAVRPNGVHAAHSAAVRRRVYKGPHAIAVRGCAAAPLTSSRAAGIRKSRSAGNAAAPRAALLG
jgi:hypothetical protein